MLRALLRPAFAVVRGAVVLLLALALGDALAARLPRVPLSGPLWGMLLLFAALASGALPEAWVRPAAAPLVRLMGLFFVPLGVGILAYRPLLAAHGVAVVAALVGGSSLTLAAAGLAARGVSAWRSRRS